MEKRLERIETALLKGDQSYAAIAAKEGVTRQYIGLVAKKLGIRRVIRQTVRRRTTRK